MHLAFSTMAKFVQLLQSYFYIEKKISPCADQKESMNRNEKRPDAVGRTVQSDGNQNSQISLPPETFEHFASQLDQCVVVMQQTCGRVESDFLCLGERLQSIYTQAVKMTEKVQSAIEHVGLDRNDSPLLHILQTARCALSRQEREQSRMAEQMGKLQGMGDSLVLLRSVAGGLRRIAKTLKMVGININIESSRATQSSESFNVLSQEIRTLSDTVVSLDQILSDEIRSIYDRLASMGQTMKDRLNRFAQLAVDAKDEVHRAEPECRTLMDRSVEALQHIGTDGEAISRNTSQIVVSLQIHDNVSQRVEHITEALADSILLIRQTGGGQLKAGDVFERVAAIDANIALQQAQLDDIISEIELVTETSGRSFGVIGEAVQEMSDNILELAKGDRSIHSNDSGKSGSIGSLRVALEKIQSLIGQKDEVVEVLKSIGRDAKKSVSRIDELMDRVETVNFDIHLKSLNAIFKSTQLGTRGQAISVLVQEMKDLATQSKELVEQIQFINIRIINLAGSLQEYRPEELAGEQDSTIMGSDDLEALIRNFADTSSAFTHQANEMVQESQALGSMIVEAGDRLSFLLPFAAQLQTLKQQLAECRNGLAPWLSDTDSTQAAALDKVRLAQRYTMEQEREIHKAILNDQSAFLDRPSKTTAACETDLTALQSGRNVTEAEELGENVELF